MITFGEFHQNPFSIFAKRKKRNKYIWHGTEAFAAPDALCFCTVRHGFYPLPNFFRFTRMLNGFLMKFAGSNHCHERIE